jgi:AraC-like DNA-binding protein
MDERSMIMYKRSMTERRYTVYRETRFRLPGAPERELGLWVDRIGAGGGTLAADRLRVLGQYAAVAVESGEGAFVSEATGRRDARAGDAILLFPGEPATYGGAPWFMRWIVWNGPEAGRIAQRGGLSPAAPVLPGGAAAVIAAVDALGPLMDLEGFPAVLARKRIVLRLLEELLALRAAALPRPSPADRLEQVIRHIGTDPAAAFSVPDLAARCHLGVSQFRRQFRRHTGRGPIEFIITRRLMRAKALLAQGLTIKAAAAQSGFSDVYYFMRLFKRVTGQTAGAFMRHEGLRRA